MGSRGRTAEAWVVKEWKRTSSSWRMTMRSSKNKKEPDMDYKIPQERVVVFDEDENSKRTVVRNYIEELDTPHNWRTQNDMEDVKEDMTKMEEDVGKSEVMENEAGNKIKEKKRTNWDDSREQWE